MGSAKVFPLAFVVVVVVAVVDTTEDVVELAELLFDSEVLVLLLVLCPPEL
jgi:hypothetical protein